MQERQCITHYGDKVTHFYKQTGPWPMGSIPTPPSVILCFSYHTNLFKSLQLSQQFHQNLHYQCLTLPFRYNIHSDTGEYFIYLPSYPPKLLTFLIHKTEAIVDL